MKRVLALILCLYTEPLAATVDIQMLKTASGLKVWLVEDHNIPFVALELRFDGGTGIDPVEKAGATNLMMSLLEEGAGDLKVQEFAAAKEALAASFGYGANLDNVSISARFLTENQDEAIALLRQSLIAPRFDKDAVERVRAQVLNRLKADKKDPNAIISKAFNDEAYGDHSYARGGSGTIETVTGLSIGDLKAAHQYAMVLDRLYVSAVGDVTAEEVTDLIENLMAGFPNTSKRPLPEQASLGLTQGVQVIDYPTPQSVALFGHEGIDRDHPDFFAAYILNQIFGGNGFASRLMREIREKRGLSYGINSYLASRDYADVYIGQFSSANDSIAEALDVLRDEWTKISRDGITQKELDGAKTYLTGAYPLRFDGNAPIARILVGMQMQGLEPNYITRRNDKVNDVTLEQANSVARWFYQPEKLRIFVIGQPAGL